MRLGLLIALAAALASALYLMVELDDLAAWAISAQRDFQNQMATAIHALRAGQSGAYLALLSGAAAYGFVHALGPGHGKYLVGGVGLGTAISTWRLLGLSVSSSLAQALWAIILVYGGFFLIEASARQMTSLAESYLAPASYAAIACVGLMLIWRGLVAVRTVRHAATDCGCHAHGPTPQEAARVGSLREAVLLVLSIAVRPCTGAIFLLIIAWQMDIHVAGIAAVLVMGLGTAMLTSLVAISSVAARGLAFASSGALSGMHVAFPALQVFAGTLIALISLGLLGVSL